MPIYRTDIDEYFGSDGSLIASRAVQVDITEDVITYDLHVKARAALAASAAALTANATYIARTTTTTAQDKAQLKALSNQVNALIRQVNALTRLALAADLLRDTAGT